MNGNEKKYGQNGQRQESGNVKKEGRSEQQRPQQGQKQQDPRSIKYNNNDEQE